MSSDGGLWGLGRWSNIDTSSSSGSSSQVTEDPRYYEPPSTSQYPSYFDSTAPSAPSYPGDYYPPYPPSSSSSSDTSSFSYPKIYGAQTAEAASYYPPVSWPSSPYVTSPPPQQQEYGTNNSGYVAPYTPYAAATPQAPGYGASQAPYGAPQAPFAAASAPAPLAPYNQVADPTVYPPPSGRIRDEPPPPPGRFRANSMPSAARPYDSSAPPPYVRCNSEFSYPQSPAYGRSSSSDYMSPKPQLYPSSTPAVYPGDSTPSARNSSGVRPNSLPRSGGATLLHGTLNVTISEAVRLPNMDVFSQKLSDFASGLSFLQKSKDKNKLGAPNVRITSDPYVTVVLGEARVARTRVVSNTVNPAWNEHFSIPVAHHVHDIVFNVKDQDMLGTQHIGDVKIPVSQVLNGGVVTGWYDVHDAQGRVTKHNAQLQLTASYIPVEESPLYNKQGPVDHAVPSTYFPSRAGCRLTLYQDTHIYDHFRPRIRLQGGKLYEPRRCWEELCVAIHDAQHLIYIAGWSVHDKVKLIRDFNRPIPAGGTLTLGELLILKAGQGVRVLLMIWDDKTSHDLPLLKTDGVMNTHDEETKRFFKGTGVRCVLAPRYGASKMSRFRKQVVGTLYSHHQKMTIVDTGPYDRRTVTSFIGGLDLTGGRWDTPSHTLFASLQREHKHDFRNKSWSYAADSGGPRQPWHDWHCKIEGHAAYDVLTNFEQRWNKATKSHDDELLDVDRRNRLLSPSNRAPPSGDPALTITRESDADTWHVQIFRSIDSGSVKGFPTTSEEVTKQCLVWGKSVAIDISIHMAYIKAIRSAQHFIYIENQYFLGSSYNWPDYKTAGANHLIPMELTLKICSKIREGKPFAVYIVIPMWPEGIPDSGPVQEILYFQTQTMKMMYSLIADTLRDCAQSHRHPTEFLNFYCLGNRETKPHGEPEPRHPPEYNSKQGKSQRNRRMMIYVHSKGMIVDDEYVISGSANINQRSMDGSRDTEIAMGGFQPYHTWVAQQHRPRGQVYGYRMSLWAEHLGPLEPIFEEPESVECVRRVNDLAEKNWQQYVAPEVTDMTGHLIRYPLRIGFDGSITTLPGFDTFPDVGGKIMGSNQENLPDDLTA